ncbi:hypothetical protein KCP74_12815 [Salmonella enterica subsp. enterica]|nr:hypothetical protein KCP74_12815 [Salmonella enterica subsp. enterica]
MISGNHSGYLLCTLFSLAIRRRYASRARNKLGQPDAGVGKSKRRLSLRSPFLSMERGALPGIYLRSMTSIKSFSSPVRSIIIASLIIMGILRS